MWTVYHDHSLSGRIDFDKYRENSRIHPVAEISRPCIFLFLNEIMRFLLHYRKKHAKRRNIFDALLSFCASECEVGKPPSCPTWSLLSCPTWSGISCHFERSREIYCSARRCVKSESGAKGTGGAREGDKPAFGPFGKGPKAAPPLPHAPRAASVRARFS